VATREDVMAALDAFLESEPLEKSTQSGKKDWTKDKMKIEVESRLR
jgi:hypothetical protein